MISNDPKSKSAQSPGPQGSAPLQEFKREKYARLRARGEKAKSKAKRIAGADALVNAAHERLARLRAHGLSFSKAAKEMGVTARSAKRYSKHPGVEARTKFLKGQEKVNAAVQLANTKVIRPIDIDRNDIIMGFVDVVRDRSSRGGEKVAALRALAEIFCLFPKSLKDVREFYGWTEDEILEHYRTRGEFIPERFRGLVKPGEMAAGGEGESLRLEKGGSTPGQ